MHYVYVLKNSEGQHYTGCTSDLKERLQQHNKGKSTFTSYRGPYELIYYEACINSKDAYAREKYLKTGMGKRYVKNRIKQYLKGESMNPVKLQKADESIQTAEVQVDSQPYIDNRKLSGV